MTRRRLTIGTRRQLTDAQIEAVLGALERSPDAAERMLRELDAWDETDPWGLRDAVRSYPDWYDERSD